MSDEVPNYSYISKTAREVPPALDVMARTIYGEARGESFQGKVEVAHTILNRVEIGGWWGDTIIKVCLKPWQFSCWNVNDPNRDLLERINYCGNPYRAWDRGILRDCLYVAHGARRGFLQSNLGARATHYFAPSAFDGEGSWPKWVAGSKFLGSVGGHRFYNEVK